MDGSCSGVNDSSKDKSGLLYTPSSGDNRDSVALCGSH